MPDTWGEGPGSAPHSETSERRAVGRVLILSFSDLSRDPRVHRQVRFLRERYSVVAAGLGDPGVAGVEFVPLTRTAKPLWRRALSATRLLARRYEAHYWHRSDVSRCLGRLQDVRADLVLANDIDALPIALALASGARVLFDAHEHAPAEFDDRLGFRLFLRSYRAYLCRTYIPRADAMTTVSESIAERYQQETGVRPAVVWNAADFESLEPTHPDANEEVIRLVHHGGAQSSRKTELMIQMMRHLDDRFELNLMLVGQDTRYLRFLRRVAGGDPRIRFLAPVPMRALPGYLNRFDVGVHLLPPTNFNNRHALPNKFFEFVQARLAVAIGPSPEMSRLVRRHGFGLVAPDYAPASLARLVSTLNRRRVVELKQRAHEAARVLSADATRQTILELAERLLVERR